MDKKCTGCVNALAEKMSRLSANSAYKMVQFGNLVKNELIFDVSLHRVFINGMIL